MKKLFENFRRYLKEDKNKIVATVSGYIRSGEMRDVKFANHPVRAMGRGWVETKTDETGFYRLDLPSHDAGSWTILVSDKDWTVDPPEKKYIRTYEIMRIKDGEKIKQSFNLLDRDRDAPNSTKNLYKPGDTVGITPPRR
tara:strand:- start:175 stop:594 length:420 start_codon:yes stop_codon:yes gene_type:complete